jgi:hypothetical protein
MPDGEPAAPPSQRQWFWLADDSDFFIPAYHIGPIQPGQGTIAWTRDKRVRIAALTIACIRLNLTAALHAPLRRRRLF